MRGKPWNFLLHGLVAGCLAMASLTAAAAPFIYVANSTQNSVSVFDAVTLTVVATVPVGTRPFPLAVSPDGTRVVVGNSGSNNASIIETAGHTVIATIPVGGNPYGVAIDPTGLRAMMANYQSNDVSVIDLTTNTVRMTIPAGTNPSGVAYTPDGSHAYVTNGGANSISVIDTATETVVATIANVGTSPWGIVMNADGTRAYVANYSSANVSVIDTTTNTVVLPRIAVGNQPVSIGINGDGSWVYTSNSGSDSVSGIALATGNVTTIPVGVRPFCAAFHPDGRRFYVQNAGNGTAVGTMNVLDTMTNTITATVPTAIYAGSFGNFVSPFTPPGIPTHVMATAADTQVMVSFLEPAYDGGTPILSYTATCGSQSQTGPVGALVVSGLTNGIAVQCRVHATNAKGSGADSAPITVTPASVPGAPTITQVVAGDGTVDVTFSAPASDGGAAISSYTATCGSAQASGASPLHVTGLTNGVPVTCTVHARNATGDGPESAPSPSVTPRGAPGAPSLDSHVRTATELRLSFTAPASDGGAAILDYTATCQPGALTATVTTAATPVVIGGIDEAPAYTCTMTARNDVGTGTASNALTIAPRSTTDLAVASSNGVTYVPGGSVVSYTVGLRNQGATAVTGAHLVDTLTGGGSATWTCSSSDGASCPASGSGAPDLVLDLPANTSLTIMLQVSVPTLPETPLVNRVEVFLPDAIRDTNPANDSATDGPDPVGLFRGRFE